MPGWNFRDKKGCNHLGNETNASSHQPVQLLVLSDQMIDRGGKLDFRLRYCTFDFEYSPGT